MSGCIDRDSVLPHLVDAIVSVALFWCILGCFPSLVVADLSNRVQVHVAIIGVYIHTPHVHITS